MRLYDQQMGAMIVTEPYAEEAILLAAKDLQRNLRRLSGKERAFPIVSHGRGRRGIFIRTEASDREEAYCVRVDKEQVEIVGSDVLGTVYGIYAFATHCLGILPVYRMVDIFPEPCAELTLTECVICSKPRPIRFRGWFINDEDLLTEFRGGGGDRRIDYRFYQRVIRRDVLDMILETALRLEINLMIPSSFVDVSNPPEEALADAVVRRGMYITQHHVEPMGVSYFAAEHYLKERCGEGEAVSFVTNRGRMEEIWRFYAQKWAKYGDRVIWQLGLRGKADRAVWQQDPGVPDSAAQRGAIISDAMATQHRIVCETLGRTDFYSTATLWMEGAELYGRGYLRVPKNTVVIFSDIGFSQMPGDDFFTTPRKAVDRYGVYFHVGYMQEGPHLAEGCDPWKMADVYRLAYERRSLFYSMLNVSNLRPLHMSAWAQAELSAALEDGDMDGALDRLTRAIFGGRSREIRALMKEYYRAFADMGAEELRKRCQKWNFYDHDYGQVPYPVFPTTDGALRYTGRYVLLGNENGWQDDSGYRQELEKSLGRWECLYGRLKDIEGGLPASVRLYLQQFLLVETFYMMELTRWRLAVGVMVRADAATERTRAMKIAVTSLRSILTERRILELGEWKGWHNGDRKIDVGDLLALTERRYEELSKERI
jgi:hypothetical protein